MAGGGGDGMGMGRQKCLVAMYKNTGRRCPRMSRQDVHAHSLTHTHELAGCRPARHDY
jgi:hypothetical protein